MSAASVASSVVTYEATKARESTLRHPDRIHWDNSVTFRDCPYRQLHHQRGLIGRFRIRLLQAADLKRSYWSALALGPVRHLGLSKAHGAVSSFCSFTMDFQEGRDDNNDGYNNGARRRPSLTAAAVPSDDLDRKPAAKVKHHDIGPRFSSPVVAQDNHPVWENCAFEFCLRKGTMPHDGMRIVLQLQVEEDATAVENMLPGMPSAESRVLGAGSLDVTDLVLGQSMQGQHLPGVRDAWVEISLPKQEEEEEEVKYNKDDPLAPPPPPEAKKPPAAAAGSSSSSTTGKVRVLISYEPYGLEPQPKDIVALECFARRHVATSSCRPLVPPLLPLTVLERRGAYLLCEYTIVLEDGNDTIKACVRLHRNAVFVIERQNLVDAAHNLALLPIDVVRATPLGQAASHALGPVVAAGRELVMPALLSFKLVWMAARTTTLAGWSGVQALGATMWQEGSSSLTGGDDDNHHHTNLRHMDARRRDAAATAQFVSL